MKANECCLLRLCEEGVKQFDNKDVPEEFHYFDLSIMMNISDCDVEI